jgi:hypothetical protein
MTTTERPSRPRKTTDAEQYDVEKDKAMLEADELAAIVRKQFIQEGLC